MFSHGARQTGKIAPAGCRIGPVLAAFLSTAVLAGPQTGFPRIRRSNPFSDPAILPFLTLTGSSRPCQLPDLNMAYTEDERKMSRIKAHL
jgi:hypothetical protein